MIWSQLQIYRAVQVNAMVRSCNSRYFHSTLKLYLLWPIYNCDYAQNWLLLLSTGVAGLPFVHSVSLSNWKLTQSGGLSTCFILGRVLLLSPAAFLSLSTRWSRSWMITNRLNPRFRSSLLIAHFTCSERMLLKGSILLKRLSWNHTNKKTWNARRETQPRHASDWHKEETAETDKLFMEWLW